MNVYVMRYVWDVKLVMTGWVDDRPVEMAKNVHMTADISENNTCTRTKDGD